MRNSNVFLTKIGNKEQESTQFERIKQNVDIIKDEIKGFIECLVNCINEFYSIKVNKNDLKRELMVNMVTNIIVKDEIYLILFGMYSQLLDDDIQKIKNIN